MSRDMLEVHNNISGAEKSDTGLHSSMRSHSYTANEVEDDATWILTSAFIIFTMQSGNNILFSDHANFTSLTPHFYIVKLGFKGVYIFLMFALKHILWLLFRTA